MVRLVQLSDTHFGPDGHRSHGGLGYDTDAAFEAVLDHLTGELTAGGAASPDLVVVTGDVADQGRPDEYAKAAKALARLPGRVNLCPGNHDRAVPYEVGLATGELNRNRTIELGSWLLLFLDSVFDGKEPGPGGRLVDREDRIASNGGLGPAEVSWVHDMVGATEADHVFLWLHHPPGVPIDGFRSEPFDAEVTELVAANDKIRGLGAGHIHSDPVLRIGDRPVFVCPALTINIDFEQATLLPPGYRSYQLDDDGTIHSEVHLMDGEEWPRHPVPEVGMQYLRGEISWEALLEGLGGATPSNPEGGER